MASSRLGSFATGVSTAAVRERLVAHIGDASSDSEAFAQRCRDALFVLLTLPEYQLN